MEVIWHEKARRQLEEAMDYCMERFGSRVTKRIINQIDKDVSLLSKNPYMGAVEDSLGEEFLEYRYLIEGPAKLIYTVEDGYVFIHLYWDCRQEPRSLWNLLKETE